MKRKYVKPTQKVISLVQTTPLLAGSFTSTMGVYDYEVSGEETL